MMKKTLLLAVIGSLVIGETAAIADIQDPPAARHTAVRKLGRGIGNIVFGITEIPDTMKREQRISGTKGAWSAGLATGTWRFMQRVGYGAFEIVTFPAPTHKGTYRQPYKRAELYPDKGLTEFAPELGFKSGTTYSRKD